MSNFSVSFTTPKGNQITIAGDKANEWVANLNEAGTSGALGVIAGIEASLSVVPSISIPTAAASPAAAPSTQPAQELPASLGVKCSTCQEPAQFVQEGISQKSGQTYKRYSCTANQLHKATFTN